MKNILYLIVILLLGCNSDITDTPSIPKEQITSVVGDWMSVKGADTIINSLGDTTVLIADAFDPTVHDVHQITRVFEDSSVIVYRNIGENDTYDSSFFSFSYSDSLINSIKFSDDSMIVREIKNLTNPKTTKIENSFYMHYKREFPPSQWVEEMKGDSGFVSIEAFDFIGAWILCKKVEINYHNGTTNISSSSDDYFGNKYFFTEVKKFDSLYVQTLTLNDSLTDYDSLIQDYSFSNDSLYLPQWGDAGKLVFRNICFSKDDTLIIGKPYIDGNNYYRDDYYYISYNGVIPPIEWNAFLNSKNN